MARGRQKQLDRMDKMEALEPKENKPHFHFQTAPLTNTEKLIVKQLSNVCVRFIGIILSLPRAELKYSRCYNKQSYSGFCRGDLIGEEKNCRCGEEQCGAGADKGCAVKLF